MLIFIFFFYLQNMGWCNFGVNMHFLGKLYVNQNFKKSAWPKPFFLNFLFLFKELGIELVKENLNQF